MVNKYLMLDMRAIMNLLENDVAMPSEALIFEFEQWKAENFPDVSVSLSENDEHSIHMDQISSGAPGQGHASACLRALCEMADRHGVTIISAIYGDFAGERSEFGTVNTKLLAWYERYGFEQMSEGEPAIWRHPR